MRHVGLQRWSGLKSSSVYSISVKTSTTFNLTKCVAEVNKPPTKCECCRTLLLTRHRKRRKMTPESTDPGTCTLSRRGDTRNDSFVHSDRGAFTLGQREMRFGYPVVSYSIEAQRYDVNGIDVGDACGLCLNQETIMNK